jgi:hypothetical protein
MDRAGARDRVGARLEAIERDGHATAAMPERAAAAGRNVRCMRPPGCRYEHGCESLRERCRPGRVDRASTNGQERLRRSAGVGLADRRTRWHRCHLRRAHKKAMAGRPTNYRDGNDDSGRRHRRRYRHKPQESPEAATRLPLDPSTGASRVSVSAGGKSCARVLDPCSQGRNRPFSGWLGWLDSNQRMAGSKPAALPLGDTPT